MTETTTAPRSTEPIPEPTPEPITEPLATPTADTAASASGWRGLAADIGIPVGVYYGLHAVGVADSTALLCATLAAGARLAVTVVRTRRVSAFAMLMLGVYAVGLVLSFVSGDPRFMLLKDSVGTAVVGVGFLASLLTARPLLLAAVENARPAQAAELARRYASQPGVRRTVRGLTALWGVGLLGEALVRIPVVYLLPISVGVAVSQVMMIAAIAGLVIVTMLWIRVARRRAGR